MGAVPTTTNAAAKTVDEIINFAFMKLGVEAIKTAVLAVPQLAWLKIPPMSWIFNWIVNWVAQNFATQFEAMGVKLVLTIQTNSENSAYKAAEAALLVAEQQLRSSKPSGDANAIQKASDDFDTALANLIHWDGSAPISH